MKPIFLAMAIAISVQLVHGQQQPCGATVATEVESFLTANNPNVHAVGWRPSSDTIVVPIVFHRIAASDSTGAPSELKCDRALATLNEAYASVRIQFARCVPDRLIADDTYFDFQYSEERALSFYHDVKGALNVYVPTRIITSSNSRVCGYAYYPPSKKDFILVENLCLKGTTLIHEVGHYLGLYHTHGRGNCGFLTDELVDGSNCGTAGDDVCDTPADPNMSGLDCIGSEVDRDCRFTGTRTDANGDVYAPDPANYMGYARNSCRTRFSPGQLDRARFYLETARDYLACISCPDEPPTTRILDVGMGSILVEAAGAAIGPFVSVEYQVNGGRYRPFSINSDTISISYLQPCDTISVRVRDDCGVWNSVVSTTLRGCDLTYCPRLSFNSDLRLDSLVLAGTVIPIQPTRESYYVHPDTITLAVAPGQTELDLSLVANLARGTYPLPAQLRVWVDVDQNGEFESTELLHDQAIDLGVTNQQRVQSSLLTLRESPYHMRLAIMSELGGACESSSGHAVDVTLVLRDEAGPALAWLLPDTLWVEAHRQAVQASFSSPDPWRQSVNEAFVTTQAAGAQSPLDSTRIDIARHFGCEARFATLTLESIRSGAQASFVLGQRPASPEIWVADSGPFSISPAGGLVDLTFFSAHEYTLRIPTWGAGLDTARQVDSAIVTVVLGENLTQDRTGRVVAAGCGAMAFAELSQEAQSTRWEDTSPVQPLGPDDVVRRSIASNVSWTATPSATWVQVSRTSGPGDETLGISTSATAPAGAEAFVTLVPSIGEVTGSDRLRVVAPQASGAAAPLDVKLRLVNPFDDVLHVETLGHQQQLNFMVTTLTGAFLWAETGTELKLNTSAWPRGVYLLRVRDRSGRQAVRRLVK